MPITEAKALEFIAAADLSGLPDYQSPFGVLGGPSFDPDAGRDQSAIVGSSITTFAKGVTEPHRQAINDSLLFAQLIANKRAPDPAPLTEWYNVYFEALTNVGWVLETKEFKPYVASGDVVDVSEALLSVASGLVGGPVAGAGAVALQLIKSTLDAISKLGKDSPWITLFQREAQHERAARFQYTLAHQNGGQDAVISLMAFEFEAQVTLTHILFAKYRTLDVSLRQASGSVSLDNDVLALLAPKIAKKVDTFADGYVMSVSLVKPKG